MAKNGNTPAKAYPIAAHQEFIDAMAWVMECFANLESQMQEYCYEKAFQEGVAHVQNEFQRVTAGVMAEVNPDPVTVPKATGLSEVEKIAEQSIYASIVNNPGWRTSDIIVKTIELPVKPALTEQSIKVAINRLKREGKIDNKAGRWYSTSPKSSGQLYQVMAYLPDGSKYLGTDVIKES